MRPKIDRRQAVLAGAAAAATVSLPGAALARMSRIVMNDASRLSPTPVARHWIVKPDEEAKLVETLRAELKSAAAEKRPIAIGAARHSMGGQSLPRDGTAITLDVKRIQADQKNKVFAVTAGTRWTDVIRALDPIGFSPAVMQSNADFGIASTFSVNAHGWPVPYGPFGATVRRIEMMLADGTIVSCSRTENSELFRHAMGGYGYFGIILKLDVDMVENTMLKPRFDQMPAGAFAAKFVQAATDPAVMMLYGRLNVARASFMADSLMISFRRDATAKGPTPAATSGGMASAISRQVYRGQVGSEAGKRARWLAETVAGPKLAGTYSRNSLMNEPVANLASRDRTRTDILHEYFVPPDRFVDFVRACQDLIPKSGQEFLNITLRYVAQDDESIMSFARTPRIAGVMSFAQEITPEAEASMLRLTEALIERVGDIGGSFYLPYRLHARRDQVAKIYPNTEQFVARKRHYDPNLTFRNGMWGTYFAAVA